MRYSNKQFAPLAILITSVLSACGGGGSTPEPTPPVSPNPPPTQGITRNGIAVGPISTFGSVVVNGVRYETNASTVFEIGDNASGSESDLRVGDTVAVVAELDEDSGTSTALRVIYDDAVTGPIESIDIAAGAIVILGQTVLITAETSFDDDFTNPSIEGLVVGQIVEVSGTPSADGAIVATRLEPKAAGTTLEVQGVVSNLDSAAQTFTINTLTIDFSSAMLEDFPNGEISDDDFVEVEGTMLGANGELIATEVELEQPLPATSEDEFIEIEGFITRFNDATDFDVAGLAVITNASTEFEGGAATDLGLNVRVEVEGSVDANGVLVAEQVQLRPRSVIEITGAVDTVDATAGTVEILGITIATSVLTRFEDKTDLNVDPLTVADISVGDFVEIRGSESENGGQPIAASRFERDDADDTELQGFVETVANPSLTILGVTIETDSNTEFRDTDDQPLSASEFFARVAVGALVEASGTESSATTIVAEELELED